MVEGELGFIVICGKYRTGKSFLMNKLLDVQGDGVF
jgi:GTPase Era involved in 16S rRNA processing